MSSPVFDGTSTVYILALSNRGPDIADNPVITGTLPRALTVTKVEGPGCRKTTRIIECQPGALGSSAKTTLKVTVKANRAACSTFTATTTTGDPDKHNNTAKTNQCARR